MTTQALGTDRGRRAGYWALGWLGLAAAAAIWQLVAAAMNNSAVPGFLSSAAAAWHLIDGAELKQDIIPSILRTVIGFGISAVAGIVIGMVTGYYQTAREYTSAVFDFLCAGINRHGGGNGRVPR